MFRLFKAELKKIFLKPSIFLVTGLIIFMLAASTFIYNPSTKSDTSLNFDKSRTIDQIYERFITSNFEGSKIPTDLLLDNASNFVNSYNPDEDVIEKLKTDWHDVEVLYDLGGQNDYKYYYTIWEAHQDDETLKTDLDNARNRLKDAINEFRNEYNEYVESEQKKFLVTKDVNSEIVTVLSRMYTTFDEPDSVGMENPDLYIIESLKNNNYFTTIINDLNKLYTFTPNQSLIDSFKETKIVDEVEVVNEDSPIVIARTRLSFILDSIETVYNETRNTNNTADKKQLFDLINNYYLTANYAHSIVTDGIIIDGLSQYTALDITNFAGIGDKSFYEMKENYTRTKYMFDTDTYRYNYADVFSIVQPSNNAIDAFDYSYFALRLCAFFITVYIVVLSAGAIAGEQAQGTLKLLAIRPFSRNKILRAKIFSTFAIAAILLFVSSLASIVIGGVTYGFNFTNVLVVLNAEVAIPMNPIILYLIAMLSMFIEITFYAILALFISSVFKSNIAAVSISTLVFFLSLVLNTVATRVPLLALIPFVNVNFFKYFGAAFLPYTTNNILSSILTPTVFVGSTLWTSLIIYVVTFVTLLIVTHIIFKKRDIR